jgi:hypothetical protein
MAADVSFLIKLDPGDGILTLEELVTGVWTGIGLV